MTEQMPTVQGYCLLVQLIGGRKHASTLCHDHNFAFEHTEAKNRHLPIRRLRSPNAVAHPAWVEVAWDVQPRFCQARQPGPSFRSETRGRWENRSMFFDPADIILPYCITNACPARTSMFEKCVSSRALEFEPSLWVFCVCGSAGASVII
jgi:hypothetical protein